MNVAIVSGFSILGRGLEMVINEEVKGAEFCNVGSVPLLKSNNDFLPDVIIFTILLKTKQEEIISSVAELTKIYSAPRFLLLEVDFNESVRLCVPKLTQMGMLGYLAPESEIKELLFCLHSVNSGNLYLSPDILKWVFENLVPKNFYAQDSDYFMNGKMLPNGNKRLTKNEMQVATMLAEGYRVSEIAKQTGRKLPTISTIKRNIFKKTCTDNIIKLREYLSSRNKAITLNNRLAKSSVRVNGGFTRKHSF